MIGYEFSPEEANLLQWLGEFAWGRVNAKNTKRIAEGLNWNTHPLQYRRRIRELKTKLVSEAGIMIGDTSNGDTPGYFMCDPNDEEDLKVARQSIENQIRPQLKKLIVFTPEAGGVLRIIESMINEIHRGDA